MSLDIDLAEPNPTRAPTSNPRRESEGPTESRDQSAREDSKWVPFDSNSSSDHGHEVQRNMAGLVIGGAPANHYEPGDMTSGSSYINSESSNSGGDAVLSPATTHSNSNRPTPNSTTPPDSRSNLQSTQANSTGNSYGTSPASSNIPTVPSNDHRTMSAFFAGDPDYANISSTGLTPDPNYTMPEAHARQFEVPNGWEMANQQTTGLTPVGEGVFRQLMGLGPMDPMQMFVPHLPALIFQILIRFIGISLGKEVHK